MINTHLDALAGFTQNVSSHSRSCTGELNSAAHANPPCVGSVCSDLRLRRNVTLENERIHLSGISLAVQKRHIRRPPTTDRCTRWCVLACLGCASTRLPWVLSFAQQPAAQPLARCHGLRNDPSKAVGDVQRARRRDTECTFSIAAVGICTTPLRLRRATTLRLRGLNVA